MRVLKVQDIDVYYGIVPVLRQVSLEIGAGETVCLLGPNGAGKTTTVKSILGLLKPRAGSIFFNDFEITGMPPHRTTRLGIGVSPEGRLVFPDMSVQENLEVGASTPGAGSQVRGLMERVYSLFPALKERHAQAAGTLSGGEQQMLAIGRALMSGPQLLILDEPSLGLSPLLILELFRSLQKLSGEGVSILLVEQNVAQALKIAQRAYLLESGRIVLEGSSSELASSETIKKSYLGL
ncbi:MAG: ABC transporter ATP-binding protein [Dehalococcoidia bacterium]